MKCEYSNCEIKPCPFCGGDSKSSFDGEFRYVMCLRCFAKGRPVSVLADKVKDNTHAYKLAVMFWNSRN